jgi:hypothetical protein
MNAFAFRRLNRQPIFCRSGSMWKGFARQHDYVDSCPPDHRNISRLSFVMTHRNDAKARLTGFIVTITRSPTAQIPIARGIN